MYICINFFFIFKGIDLSVDAYLSIPSHALTFTVCYILLVLCSVWCVNFNTIQYIRACTGCQRSKLAIIVFKSLRGETPSYLADCCQLIADSGRRCIRSADANALTVPRTNTPISDRSFSVAGPKVLNSLLATLRQPDVELRQFKRLLKTFLFGEAAAH